MEGGTTWKAVLARPFHRDGHFSLGGSKGKQSAMAKKIKVLVIEADQDHLNDLLASMTQEADCKVVGSGRDISEVFRSDSQLLEPPEVLVINMDNQPSIGTRDWAVVRSLFPSIKVVALTSGSDSSLLEQLLAVGAVAIYTPDVEYKELRKAMDKAVEGKLTISHRLVDKVKELLMSPSSGNEIGIGGLIIDQKNQEVICRGKKVQLTVLEYKLLMYLVSKRGAPARACELLAEVWSTTIESGGTTDQVKSCIKRLRKKIELEPNRPRYLRYVQGRGYVLSNPIESYNLK